MHPIPSRRRWIGLACAALCAAPLAWASGYPDKPVKLVVPYPPGGPTDIVARVVAQKLQEQMGQPFVVDNRPGAGANIGAEAVARSTPDGYTLVVATTAHAINPSLFARLNYSITKDFAPVSQLTSGPLVIVTRPWPSPGASARPARPTFPPWPNRAYPVTRPSPGTACWPRPARRPRW